VQLRPIGHVRGQVQSPLVLLCAAHALSSASDDEEEEDEWDCIRKYIDDWNTNSAEMLHCGWLLCLDELMSSEQVVQPGGRR
jgi:hypothetical protein